MSGGTNGKVSAASARAHTRSTTHSSSSSSGFFKKFLVVFLIGISAWGYQSIQPSPPNICGSVGGPPVTAPRIKLRDGRYLAYQEHGVPRQNAKHKIVYIHGFASCRHDAVFATFLSPEIMDEFGVYMVSFDRPGYGESDPDPNRTPKSIALDIEELADELQLGSKFYVLGLSMGGQITWTCLKYIPHRLAGATLVAPVINYWWRNLPSNISQEAFNEMFIADQWALRVGHYAPWLTYWWNTQKWFPASSVIAKNPDIFSPHDKLILAKLNFKRDYEAYIRQQGDYESLHRDIMVAFGDWEFDPLDLQNPFQNNEGSVHLWHGDEDRFVPVSLQRYIAQKLPWIHYHEIPDAGHLMPLYGGMVDNIIKTLLTREIE